MLVDSLAHHLAPADRVRRGVPAPRRVKPVLCALIAAGLAWGVLPAVPAAAAQAPAVAPAPSAVSPAAVSPAILAVRQSQPVPLVCFDRDLLAYINKARAAYRLAPLVEASALVTSANRWSLRLASDGLLRHNAMLSATVLSSMPGARVFGENVATFGTGKMTAYAMLKAYLGSAQHRANILSPRFRFAGIVTRSGATGSFNTIDFAG